MLGEESTAGFSFIGGHICIDQAVHIDVETQRKMYSSLAWAEVSAAPVHLKFEWPL